MKKTLIFIISGLLIYFNSIAQQQTTFHDIVSVKLPKNVEKLSNENLGALKPKNEKSSPISYEKSNGESYKAKHYLIQLNAASINPQKDFLEQAKKDMDNLFALAPPPIYSSTILRYQTHATVLINYEYLEDSKGYYIFRSYNRSGESTLVGTMQYDKANKEAAEKALNKIMKSIKFKK